MVEQVGAATRESDQRRAAILVNLRGRDVEGFVRQAMQRLKAEVKMPPGYYYEFGGQFENLQQARARLMLTVPMALVFIFILIFLSFGLPEGDGYNLVVQLKQTAEAKPRNFRFKLETHLCDECKRPEYACICGH